MPEICGSILAANHAHLARDLHIAEKSGISRFHIDVCDGHYTENIIFGDQLVTDLRKETASVLDVHLAVYNMPVILESFMESGADCLTIQCESSELPGRLLRRIRNSGKTAGLCFIPATGFDDMEYYIDEADVINILGVDPGIGGQPFIAKVLSKIEKTANYISRKGLHTKVSVDGGVNLNTIPAIMNAGADILIIGSGIFRGNIENNTKKIKGVVANG